MNAAAAITDFRDAKGEKIQPYFAAFMIEHGYRTAAEAFSPNGHGYMLWNQRMWAEFEADTGKPVGRHEHRRGHAPEFTAWLQDRVIDASARQFVEAA